MAFRDSVIFSRIGCKSALSRASSQSADMRFVAFSRLLRQQIGNKKAPEAVAAGAVKSGAHARRTNSRQSCSFSGVSTVQPQTSQPVTPRPRSSSA